MQQTDFDSDGRHLLAFDWMNKINEFENTE